MQQRQQLETDAANIIPGTISTAASVARPPVPAKFNDGGLAADLNNARKVISPI